MRAEGVERPRKDPVSALQFDAGRDRRSRRASHADTHSKKGARSPHARSREIARAPVRRVTRLIYSGSRSRAPAVASAGGEVPTLGAAERRTAEDENIFYSLL
jgi:hypothetical protein